MINVLVFIHGITPEQNPTAHTVTYDAFWAALQRVKPQLTAAISLVCRIEWGNSVGTPPFGPDALLSAAERRASNLVRYDHVSEHPSPNNSLLPFPGDLSLTSVLRPLVVTPLREKLLQFGLADAVYYASEDGERAVRANVYGKVLAALRPHRSEHDVRLHVVAHSLGVAISHDFLYGLFGKPSAPDFLGQAARPEDSADYNLWRAKAGAGELKVGTLVSMASQMSMFALRKQALVERLAQGGFLETDAIGIPANGPVRWLVFYDIDDVLGFATRELYGNPNAIHQSQVDSGDTPIPAHTGYWQCDHVIRETATLIASRVT